MADFTDIEIIFNYQTLIKDYIFRKFPEETFFVKYDLEKLKGTTIEEVSKVLYGTDKYSWMILFFNPSLKVEDFGFSGNTNENTFLNSKLEYIYKRKLKQDVYDLDQINKVFDSINQYKKVEVLLPKSDQGSTIKRNIFEYIKKTYRGKA